MQQFTTAIPVKATAYEGLGDVSGMLSFDGSFLTLEFQTSDALFGVLKSGTRTLQIPLEMISGVRSRQGFCWLFPNVQIDLMDFKLLAQFPGAKDGTITLNVPWRYRQRAREFVGTLSYVRTRQMHDAIAEHVDERMNARMDQRTSGPPIMESTTERRNKSEKPTVLN
jgi:hypothetical protein